MVQPDSDAEQAVHIGVGLIVGVEDEEMQTMARETTPRGALTSWTRVLGDAAMLGAQADGRDLWPVIASDGAHYVLKRLGPWRNLPLVEEARMVVYLAGRGIAVAEFVPTDRGEIHAGTIEESYVLMPKLPNDALAATEIVAMEGMIGEAVATLHLALAACPFEVNSYTEHLDRSLAQQQLLPPDVAGDFANWRDRMIDALRGLPVQRIHGDLTPENVLLSRPGAVAGFIDFDHLPLASRLWDVGKYCARRMRLRWSQGVPESALGRLDHVEQFLAGYHRTYPLTEAEIAAIPASIAAGNVLEVTSLQAISNGTLPRRRMPDHDDILANTIEVARWHLAHVEEVVGLVHSSVG